MVTAPSLNGVPNLSPTLLSGAMHVGREAAGFLQHGVDVVGGELAALRQRARKARAVLQREGDVGDRCAVGHAAKP